MKRLFLLVGMAALTGAILTGALASAANAAITLQLVNSYARSAPFGLAFDGTNLHWQSSSNVIHEMTTAGVDTGLTTINPLGWSALAWSGTQLVSAQNQQIRFFDKFTGANQSSLFAAATDQMTGIIGLQDGLDFDHNEIWVSPDVGNVYRFTNTSPMQSVVGDNGTFATPVLGGAGGFSGVERVDIGMTSLLIVVNDASNPRRLDLRQLDGTLIDQATFANQRYEDLAFDGRYLWAADFFGNKIDQFDILGADGGSIFDPPNTGDAPEPATIVIWTLLGSVASVVAYRRRRK